LAEHLEEIFLGKSEVASLALPRTVENEEAAPRLRAMTIKITKVMHPGGAPLVVNDLVVMVSVQILIVVKDLWEISYYPISLKRCSK
jgi:hypothetical protein